MARDPFAPISKKKLGVYGAIAACVLLFGAIIFLRIGIEPWRVALIFCAMAAFTICVIGGVIWLTGGRRSEAAVGPAAVRPPTRLMKALPYMFAVIFIFQLLTLLQMLVSR
jgi:hypothetical protein